MSAKMSAARVDAFFAALAQTGNQSIAAERAKVSRSWVQLHRSGDAAFRARYVAALGTARRGLRRAKGLAPAESWGSLDGEELVVRGSNGRRAQVARARLRQWSPRVEARFLQVLAATCNVKAACAAVGMSVPGVYAHRHRWPAFARAWDEAVQTGGARLEIGLMYRGENMFSDPDALGDEAGMDEAMRIAPPVSFAEAIQLLALYRYRLHQVGKPVRNYWRRPRTMDEMRDSILRKLSAIDAAQDYEPAELDADAACWARQRAARSGG